MQLSFTSSSQFSASKNAAAVRRGSRSGRKVQKPKTVYLAINIAVLKQHYSLCNPSEQMQHFNALKALLFTSGIQFTQNQRNCLVNQARFIKKLNPYLLPF